jgi:hypothetical protein
MRRQANAHRKNGTAARAATTFCAAVPGAEAMAHTTLSPASNGTTRRRPSSCVSFQAVRSMGRTVPAVGGGVVGRMGDLRPPPEEGCARP